MIEKRKRTHPSALGPPPDLSMLSAVGLLASSISRRRLRSPSAPSSGACCANVTMSFRPRSSFSFALSSAFAASYISSISSAPCRVLHRQSHPPPAPGLLFVRPCRLVDTVYMWREVGKPGGKRWLCIARQRRRRTSALAYSTNA
jgi:hypothetical protein